MDFKEIFLNAIHSKNKLIIKFYSKEDGCVLTRTVAPYDYGPSRRYKHNKEDRYHFHDYDSDKKQHTLSITPEYLRNLEFLDEKFNPDDLVTWVPDWIVPRDWGNKS